MVIAGLRQEDFLALLKFNGYEVLSSTYWDLEDVERIVIGKDGHTFAFRLKKYYYHNEVSKRCGMLGINKCPSDLKDEYEACLKASIQYLDYLKTEQEMSEAENAQLIEKDKNSNPEEQKE